jgi:hypothetical protein
MREMQGPETAGALPYVAHDAPRFPTEWSGLHGQRRESLYTLSSRLMHARDVAVRTVIRLRVLRFSGSAAATTAPRQRATGRRGN